MKMMVGQQTCRATKGNIIQMELVSQGRSYEDDVVGGRL